MIMQFTFVLTSKSYEEVLNVFLVNSDCCNSNFVFTFMFHFLINFGLTLQIVGTSKNFQKKKRHLALASDSEDSYSSSSLGKLKNNKVQSFSPSTPPPTSVNYRTAKRRKGIPHRSPMGGLIIEY